MPVDDIFHDLSPGDELTVTVHAHDGDLEPDELETYELEFVGQQNLQAQSRIRSWELRRTDDPKSSPIAYIRVATEHRNNFGFRTSFEGDKLKFVAEWVGLFDDRDRHVEDIELT